jgi:hypothetical protein
MTDLIADPQAQKAADNCASNGPGARRNKRSCTRTRNGQWIRTPWIDESDGAAANIGV